MICAIFKFQGAKFTFFGTRYDVVLTNSMSEKSEKYKEFLKGHDDQFQAFDLAKSKPIEKPEDLKVYDVVIYKDRTVGTNMHRIVGIEEKGHDTIEYIDAAPLKINEYDGIQLLNIGSKVETSDISFKYLEMKVYTETGSDDKHYNFSSINNPISVEVSSENVGSGKIITYKINKDSAAPGPLSIAHSCNFDFSKEVIVSLKIDASSGTINATKGDVTFEGNKGFAIYNQDYRFEIRGDKSETSDGYYSFKEIEAKVIGNSPKAGYFIRFLNSLWGGLMFILLGCVILGYDIISARLDKKAKKAKDSGSSNDINQVSQDSNNQASPKEEVTIDVKDVAEITTSEHPIRKEPTKEESVAEQTKNNKVTSEKKSTRWTKENNPTLNKKRESIKKEQ